MATKITMDKQRGGISVIIIIIGIALLLLWQIWKPSTLSQRQTAITMTCDPTVLTNEPDVAIDRLAGQTPKHYKLIKRGQLVDKYYTSDGASYGQDGTVHVWETTGGPRYNGKYVYIYQGGSGTDAKYVLEDGTSIGYSLADLLSSLGGSDESLLYITDKNTVNANNKEYFSYDIYLESHLVPQLAKVDVIKKCIKDSTYISTYPTPTFVVPSQAQSDGKQLQMQYFTVKSTTNVVPWWLDPHCKPLIYLYPEHEQQVHVKLNPKGYLTETIPQYPQEGWVVNAAPDGLITYQGKTYDYLYYESKIHDSETKIPETGYVRKFYELESLYNTILPKLGLNEKESKEFIAYWTKYLPFSPYYFVGILNTSSIEHIEPLTITPKPDTMIRVRVYFKPVGELMTVTEPSLKTVPSRNGFTVVEWGGMVKTDMNHPFTCSQ